MKRILAMISILAIANGCYFSPSTWKSRLEAVGWSRASQPLFLESYPAGISLKGPKEAPVAEIRPSGRNYVLHGPKVERHMFPIQFPGYLFYAQIRDEASLLLIGRIVRSNEQRLVAYVMNIADGTLSQILDIQYNDAAPAEIRFSKDYRFAGLATENGVDIIDTSSGALRKYLNGYRIHTVEFSDDSRHVAAYVRTSPEVAEDAGLKSLMTTVSDSRGQFFSVGIAIVSIESGRIEKMNPIEFSSFDSVIDFSTTRYGAKNFLVSPDLHVLRFRLNFTSDKQRVLLAGISSSDTRVSQFGKLYSGSFSPNGLLYGFYRNGSKMRWVYSDTEKLAGEYKLSSDNE